MKDIYSNKELPTPQRRSRIAVFASLAIPFSCLLMQSCSTTGSRANEKAAAIGALAPADRQLAMRGEIHRGFSEDAVYVAWGAPSAKKVNNTAHGPQECWTYTTTFNGYGGGYFGISRGLVHGKNGDHYDTDNYYPAPDTAQTLGGTPSTEVPIKRVIFDNGKVVSYETTQQSKDDSNDGDVSATDESEFRSYQENNLLNPG
jgi:hypothetical protein